MPGFNRTGPTGQGSMTGRCRGFCNRFTQTIPGSDIRSTGFGNGMRRGNRFNRQRCGMGFGSRFSWNQAPVPDQTPAKGE